MRPAQQVACLQAYAQSRHPGGGTAQAHNLNCHQTMSSLVHIDVAYPSRCSVGLPSRSKCCSTSRSAFSLAGRPESGQSGSSVLW